MDKKDLSKIENWSQKIHHDFEDSKKLYQFLFETLDHFYYRYLETTKVKNLKTTELAPNTYGAESFEENCLEYLKIKHSESKKVLIELAKNTPKPNPPTAYFCLKVIVHELLADRGKLTIISEVRGLNQFIKETPLQYQDLSEFRKKLAIKLEESCEIFI